MFKTIILVSIFLLFSIIAVSELVQEGKKVNLLTILKGISYSALVFLIFFILSFAARFAGMTSFDLLFNRYLIK